MKKRLTSGAIEHYFFKDMEVYSTNVKRNYHPCEVTKYLNINNMPKKLAHWPIYRKEIKPDVSSYEFGILFLMAFSRYSFIN